MRRILMFMGCIALLTSLTGCNYARPLFGFGPGYQALAKTAVMPPPGFIYQDISAPLSYNYAETNAAPAKTGSASTSYISLWPILGSWASLGMENASLEQAARNGGLKEVTYADYKMFNVLGVYSQFTVIAHGN